MSTMLALCRMYRSPRSMPPVIHGVVVRGAAWTSASSNVGTRAGAVLDATVWGAGAVWAKGRLGQRMKSANAVNVRCADRIIVRTFGIGIVCVAGNYLDVW